MAAGGVCAPPLSVPARPSDGGGGAHNRIASQTSGANGGRRDWRRVWGGHEAPTNTKPLRWFQCTTTKAFKPPVGLPTTRPNLQAPQLHPVLVAASAALMGAGRSHRDRGEGVDEFISCIHKPSSLDDVCSMMMFICIAIHHPEYPSHLDIKNLPNGAGSRRRGRRARHTGRHSHNSRAGTIYLAQSPFLERPRISACLMGSTFAREK